MAKNNNDKFNEYMYNEESSESKDLLHTSKINKDLLNGIEERAPFFSAFAKASYLSQAQMGYMPRTTISTFNNTKRPSYLSKPLLTDKTDRQLYETFLDPFINRTNTGEELIKRTVNAAEDYIPFTSTPDYHSIHTVDYYKERFKNLFTYDKSIAAYDTETIGENIWQIGYAYGVKGVNTDLNNPDELLSGNTILLPDKEKLDELRQIADSDYETLTPQQKVIYKTLSNMGSDDTVFNRTIDDNGFADYQMESYADADVSRKNALRGYDKLRSLAEQSKNDKTFSFDGHTLRSDQKQFLDVIGGKIYSADMVYGHNIERFDMPKLIHNISMIDGGWDYLSKYHNIESSNGIDVFDKMFDTNDAIRALTGANQQKLQDFLYGYDSLILANSKNTPFQLSSLEDVLNLRDAYDEYKGENRGVSHAADFDAKMSFALLKDQKFMDKITDLMNSEHNRSEEEQDNLMIGLSKGNSYYFDKGSFGYINQDSVRLLKQDANGNILFDTGYGINSDKAVKNGFEADYHTLNGAAIPKDTVWQVKDMEYINTTKLPKNRLDVLKKTAPQLLDDNLLHVSFSNTDDETIHLFGTEASIRSSLGRMVHDIAEDDVDMNNEKRNLDRSRRTIERASDFTQAKISDLNNVVNEIMAETDADDKKAVTNILMKQASAISYGVASGKALTLEQQKALGITDEQANLIMSKAKKVSKWFDFGKDSEGMRQVGSLGYLRNLGTIVGSMPDSYFEYINTLVNPVMNQVDDILNERLKNGDFVYGSLNDDTKSAEAIGKAKRNDIRKEISGIVHQQIAEEIARRHPELALKREENKYLLDTVMQGDQTAIGKKVVIDLSKETTHYNFIKQVTDFYDIDPELIKQSPSRQFDTLIRFVEESNDPALQKLKRYIDSKTDNGFNDKELARYKQVQQIIYAEHLNPKRLSTLIIDNIREFRNANPDAGIYTRNNVDLSLAKEHPELFDELAKNTDFKSKLLANAKDAARHTAGTPDSFVKEIMNRFVQSDVDVADEINRLYGENSKQANHLFDFFQTIRTEYQKNIESIVKSSIDTQLKFDRTSGQFVLYDASGRKGTDITKYLPKIEMHGGTLAARFGSTSYALNMGFDYTGNDLHSTKFSLRSNLERAFDSAYSIRNRQKTSDTYNSVVGYLRDMSKKFRDDGAVLVTEGNLQEAKYNFSLDFSHSYKGMVALSNDADFLSSLSAEDASEFKKQFYTAYSNLKDPTNFMTKLSNGELNEAQRNIVNRILPDLNNYMIASHDAYSGGSNIVKDAQTELWNNHMSQLYFDYKNHMVSEGIILTDNLNVGGESFTRLSRDIQNQTTRATMFSTDRAVSLASKLGILGDISFGEALMTRVGSSWFNDRDNAGGYYTGTIQAPVFVGNNEAFSNRVSSFVSKLDSSEQGIIDQATKQPINELSGYSLEQIKRASQQLVDKTNVNEGGAILDARLVDITGIQNDLNPTKITDDLRIAGYENIKDIKELQDKTRLVPVIETLDDGTMMMRYVPGRYYESGKTVFKKVNGYAASEQVIRQKENGIVKYGVFNTMNKLVDAKTVSYDVMKAAKESGKELKTETDFYNILRTTLKDKYYEAYYNDKVDGQGVVKMVRDMSEKAETTQIYGTIGSVFPEVKKKLRKLGLDQLPDDISYNVFKDLTSKEFVYNDYLASLVNQYIRKNNFGKENDDDKISYADIKGHKRRTIRNASDWGAWVSSRIGHEGYAELTDKLTKERYLMSHILHSATGGFGVDMDAFIHHNGVWQPVNQLISDMLLYARKQGHQSSEYLYNILQPESVKNAVFLLPDKNGNAAEKALRFSIEKGILLPEGSFNINLKNLQNAAEKVYGRDLGRKRFTEIMGGYADADNDQNGIGVRDIEGKEKPLASSRAGYTTTTSLSFIHDNTRNGYLGGMNVKQVYDKVNKAGNVSDRELSKVSLIRRTEESISAAQDLWKRLGGDDESFRSIYGISKGDDVKLAKNLNESIENPYIKEIRSNQFFTPEQIIQSYSKTNPDITAVSNLSREQYDALSEREKSIIESLYKNGYDSEKISLSSVKELAHGVYGTRAVMANKPEGISELDRKTLINDYGFSEKNIADINNVHTKQLVEGSTPNIFNTNMILNMEDKSLGISKDIINKYGGVSTVAVSAVSPRAFGSQEITTDINSAFDRLQSYRSRIASLQEKAGTSPTDEETRNELQRLYRNYALTTRDIVAAQKRVVTGNISPLKAFSHIGMAYSIRPKVGVASEESFYDRNWAQKAQFDGMTVSDYTRKGEVAPDIVRISTKQAREMGLLTAEKGTDLYNQQLHDLTTNGTMVHVNRSPSNYAGSDVAARLYVGTDVQNVQVQMSHYLAAKMKADTDGDAARITADQFVYKHNVLMESQVRMLNNARDNQEQFNALVKSYGLHNISTSDMDAINTKWNALAGTHRESEIYQQTIVNPALKHANQTFDDIVSSTKSNLLSDEEMNSFRNEFAEQIIPDRLVGKNQDVLIGKSNIPMVSSKNASKIRHDYDLLQQEFRKQNELEPNAKLTDEQQKQFMRWTGQDEARFATVSRYNNLVDNTRNMLGKTRQAAAGIVDLPVYRMSRMAQMAQQYLPGKEATEMQNLFTVMQEGFLSPKNSNARDWNAVSDLIDITGRMGKMRNGTLDQSAFDDLAEWIRNNAAKAPNVRTIDTPKGPKLNTEYYAKMAQEKLPSLFKKMPNFFKEMSAMDMVFLSRKGVDMDTLKHGLEAASHTDVSGNNMSARLLNIIGQNLSDNDRNRIHLKDTSNIVLPQVQRNREITMRPYNFSEATHAVGRRRYESALKKASASIEKVGGAKKLIAGIVGGLGLAGYMGGNPSEDPNAEEKLQQQKQPVNTEPMPDFSDTSMFGQRSLSSANGGYIINVNAQSKKGSDFAQQVINQAASNTFNQMNVNITTHVKQDNAETSPDMVADYVQEALSH